MEVFWPGVRLEQQLLAHAADTANQIQAASATYTTAHSNAVSLTHWVKARDRIHILMDTSWIRYHWATAGTPENSVFLIELILYIKYKMTTYIKMVVHAIEPEM